MISTIAQIESNKPNPFGKVSNKKPDEYWLMPSLPNDQYLGESAQLNQKYFITPEEARKTNNLSIIGLSIAGVTVLTAAGIFFVLKGGPKGLQNYFKKLKLSLEQKVQASRLENSGNLTFANKFNIYAIKSLDLFLKRSQSINNFTTFKDLLFKKMMGLTKTGKRIHYGITRQFEKIGAHAVRASYADTAEGFEGLTRLSKAKLVGEDMEKYVVVNGKRLKKSEALQLASGMTNRLMMSYRKDFGEFALFDRYINFKRVLVGLKSKFENFKVFLTKGLYSNFIADSLITQDKIALQNAVKISRKNISYSYLDMASEIDSKIMEITSKLNFKDADKIKRLRSIRSTLKKYVKDPVNNAYLKKTILEELDTLSSTLNSAASTTENGKLYSEVLNEVGAIRSNLLDFKQGKVQDILDIYRQTLPADEYKAVEKEFNKAVKKLDKSIKKETEDYTSKLRDLTLGSAPTDILTVVGSLGVLGYELGKSDDNDQRMSIFLKYGFPALAGIGTMIYCNAKLFAGTKALIFASISSLISNKIGVIADNLRKKYKSDPALEV